jgi:hypothetical protein
VTRLDELFRARLAVVVPGMIAPGLAAELRMRLEPRYARYALLDRGSYDVAPLGEPALLARLVEVAAERTGRELTVVAARAIRLRPGDYLLARHDAVHDDERVELTLELSATAIAGADVHYRRDGDLYAHFPPAPGALTIVERDARVTCSHAYVSKLAAPGEVVRLVAQLR